MKRVKEIMIGCSIAYPKTVLVILVLLTFAAGSFFPQIKMDTDPENMLEKTEPVRVFHNKTKQEFDLSDVVVVGVTNDKHPDGVFNPTTLQHVYELTEFAKTLRWKNDNTPEHFEGVIAANIIAPSTIDHLSQAGAGSIRFEWLMPTSPQTKEESLAVRERILSNPMLAGMVGSKDGRAICLYLPLTDKLLSYRIFTELNKKIAGFGDSETWHITGLPVAEGAVGVEMFTEMKLASPLSMLVIFCLLFIFFRKWKLIILPMIIATVSIVISMGLMIGLGFEIHILSSMLPIFLMSISIVDCVHVLSEFFDLYTMEKGRKESIKEVMNILFVPMLYTSLTTSVGFLSLTLTSLPPARVFGVFLCFGVMLAWLCTIMFVPAYIMLIPEKQFRNFGFSFQKKAKENWLTKKLQSIGSITLNRPKTIIGGLFLILLISIIGISQIKVNDNYSKRFAQSHPIRKADNSLNSHFSGTYTAYLVLKPQQNPDAERQQLQNIRKRFLIFLDKHITANQASSIVYRDVLTLFPDISTQEVIADEFLKSIIEAMEKKAESSRDNDYDTWQTLCDFLLLEKEKLKPFKRPEVVSYMSHLGSYLEKSGLVGKATSIANIVQKVNQELTDGSLKNHKIPASSQKLAECYMQYQQSHRPQDLWQRVTSDFTQANIMLQMSSGNSMDMDAVVTAVDKYIAQNPIPANLEYDWAGLHYVNLVFQKTMSREMLWAFMQSFIVVLIMMVCLFRSIKWGVLCVIPLSITITGIYGAVGIIGQDYDMAVAVLSVLSIGIAVDFAIHFLSRSRVAWQQEGSWEKASPVMFGEPARSISRNVMVVAIGFLPLTIAQLIPYKITGLMLFAILLFSGCITLILLPAIIGNWESVFFPGKEIKK